MLRDWEAGYISGNQAVMDFYWNRFSDELTVAAEQWLLLDPLNNPDAPTSPLNMPEYRVEEAIRADQLDDQADAHVINGEKANSRSGEYVFNTVAKTTVLLFAGLATKVNSLAARGLAIALSAVFLIGGTCNCCSCRSCSRQKPQRSSDGTI